MDTTTPRKLYNEKLDTFDTHATARIIGCAPYTLRCSRCTGTLFGVDAPKYIKRGKKVFYRRETIESWLAQFSEQRNTAECPAA
jgi:hypothetical protein